MPEPVYLATMDDLATLNTLAAQDAAKALIALGWPVERHRDDFEVWKLGDFILTDADLMGFAARHGICPAVDLIH